MEIDEDVDQFRRRVDKFVSDAFVEERPGIGIIEEIVDFAPFRHEIDVGTPQISLRGGTFGGPSVEPCALSNLTLSYEVSTFDSSLLCDFYPGITISGTLPEGTPVSGTVGINLFTINTQINTMTLANCPVDGTFTTTALSTCEIECDTVNKFFHLHFNTADGDPDLTCGDSCGAPSRVVHDVDVAFADIHGIHDVTFNDPVSGLTHHWILTIVA